MRRSVKAAIGSLLLACASFSGPGAPARAHASSATHHDRDRRHHDWDDSDARCHDPPVPPTACDARLDFTFTDFRRRGVQAPNTLLVFLGAQPLTPTNGVYSVPLRDAEGRWIRDPEAVSHRHYTGAWNSANLPKGAYAILRLGNGRVLHGLRGYMGQGSAVHVQATAKVVGATVVGTHNYAPDKFERPFDGIATPMNAGQDEFRQVSETTVVAWTTVTTKGDYLVMRLKCANAGDLCAGVTCQALSPCHDVGTCDPATGQCSNPQKANGTSCSDGNACTQNDTCQDGVCTAGAPIVCQAASQCHEAGVCNPTTGQCDSPPKPQGTPCEMTDPCQMEFACDGSGACVGVRPVVCPERACNDAVCDPIAGGCVYTANDSQMCSDGDACTQSDACIGGICVGMNAVECAGPGQCHSANICDSADGQCKPVLSDNGTPCDDGNYCTDGDTCRDGQCQPGPEITCNDANACTVDTCDPRSGCWYIDISTHCPQDGDPCHTAYCHPAIGCYIDNVADGTPCNDGNACNQSGTCQSGACTGTRPIQCGPNESCSAGQCVCAPGTTLCGGQCTDLRTDVANCGGCGNVCQGEGASCQAGQCAQAPNCTVDNEAPTIRCKNPGNLSLFMGPQEIVQVPILDLIESAHDNCTPSTDLRYEVRMNEPRLPVGTLTTCPLVSPTVTLDCVTANGVELTVYATDAHKNTTSCNIKVSAQDNLDICGPSWTGTQAICGMGSELWYCSDFHAAVDVRSDNQHCGQCGNACTAPGARCEGGQCRVN